MTDGWGDLNNESARQIFEFGIRRLASERVTPSRVWTELNFLRRLLLIVCNGQPSADLLALSLEPERCAASLRRPGCLPGGTASTMWQTFQRFIEEMVEPPDHARKRIEGIRERLIQRPVNGWHREGYITGGYSNASKPRRPILLFPEDLLALTERAKQAKLGERAQRDAALVALICWSPLTVREMESLRWEDLVWDSSGDPFTAWATCERRGIALRLPVHKRAAEPLALLYAIAKRIMDRTPEGPVFRALRHPYTPLQYRDIKEVLDRCTHAAGLRATRHDLLAAYAYYLFKAHGFAEPDLRECLGYGEPKHARNLLAAHRAWEADRKVDMQGGLFSDLG